MSTTVDDPMVKHLWDKYAVTAEMMEAGLCVWRRSGRTDECLEADKLLLAEIYQRMAMLDPKEKERNDHRAASYIDTCL